MGRLDPPRRRRHTRRLVDVRALERTGLRGENPHVQDPTAIAHWQRLDDRTTTSGQPTEAQLADLARQSLDALLDLDAKVKS